MSEQANTPPESPAPPAAPAPAPYSDDVQLLEIGDRRIFLVGTAHISQESVDLVRQVIEGEQPDCVCIELDERRHEALSQKKRWEGTDLREVIRNRQLATLLINFLLSSYQKRLGGKLGVTPGSELLEASEVAKERGLPVSLVDRDVRITLRRAWGALSLWQKSQLLSGVFASTFDTQEISEEQLREIRQKDVLSELMEDLGRAMPDLKRVLIDERDAYLAQKIRDSEGKTLVAVVGAGHVAGMKAALLRDADTDIAALDEIPPPGKTMRNIGWAASLAILGSIAYIGYDKGLSAAGDNALVWFLANAIPCAIGNALALGHPLAVVAGFVAAPFTSLTPLIGAGYVTAFVQAYLVPPRVIEFQTVSDDVATLSNWWRSRLLRVFLVFILSGIGSLIGTWVGAAKIISNLVS